MTVIDTAVEPEAPTAAAAAAPNQLVIGSGRARRVVPVTDRVWRDGKFFRLGAEKYYVRGVTYGPFAPNADGDPLPSLQQVRQDFAQMRQLGANCARIYHVPPRWFLDEASVAGIKIFLDVAWPKNLNFVGDPELTRQAHDAVRHAACTAGNHPALFAISVVNEIPAEIVRFVGAKRIECFIDDLVAIAKAEAPHCLVTFANFPTTEYVQPRDVDFVCFNVYLHDDTVFRNYLARLQMIAGEKPLMLGEYGIDTFREYDEDRQAEILVKHVRAVFDEGLVGTFVFSFTDDWHTHGYQIEDWAFGLVRRDRSPKPAFHALAEILPRVPQVADVALPKISVVICSYNGASTVEACLSSMERIRYPDYEVVFVDDGSKDNTQEIVRQFPHVVNIRQENKGLSYARNVGAKAATGEIVIYTDSDCEADEDWLYYIGLSMVRGGHAGMGGPNLIPDEGSWVADCVGLSPGGPTHVMVDDRTAEHVPGCNMAFYKWAIELVNGFDSQFRKAGDDVDFIWRLQHLGHSIGFSPAAQVWHYRRNSVEAYLKQQRGYGEAEALLKYKHPDHFNTLGASHWRGRIYGGETIGVRVGGDVIYHGLFGTGLFQTIYRKPASLAAMMLMSIEWHLLYGFTFLLSMAFASLGTSNPVFWIAASMAVVPMGLSVVAAVQSPLPRHRHWLTRPLIAWLHYRQPIARGWARYSVRLRAKVMRHPVKGYAWSNELPFDPNDPSNLRYWNKDYDRFPLLKQIGDDIRAAGWRTRPDSGWSPWDLEIYASRYAKVHITTATEHHHGSGYLTHVRVTCKMSTFCRVLMAACVLLAGILLWHMWPFSRPSVLIPLVWLAMYAINRRMVIAPVLGLVDAAATKAGYYPVPTKKAN